MLGDAELAVVPESIIPWWRLSHTVSNFIFTELPLPMEISLFVRDQEKSI